VFTISTGEYWGNLGSPSAAKGRMAARQPRRPLRRQRLPLAIHPRGHVPFGGLAMASATRRRRAERAACHVAVRARAAPAPAASARAAARRAPSS
jgi:hypothetical protein